MNEIPLSVFEMVLALDLIVIAYALYGINFNVEVKVDKIIAAIISSPLSFILSSSIINGNIVTTYADTDGFHYIPFQSLPLHYFLMGFAVLMTLLSMLLIVKFISDYFENLEKKSALSDWRQNSFTNRR